ncbi:hypothetical protein RKD27_004085 [Streptomyces sp. SAI-126]
MSDSKRSSDTFSQRNWEPFTPLLSRLLQEQLPRVPASEVPFLPDFDASGTSDFRVFEDSTPHESGSDLYAAACTVGAALAEADAPLSAPLPLFALPLPLSPPEPESEEQPVAISITGTAAAQTRTR